MVTKTTLARFSWCISPGVAKQNTAPLSLVTDEDNHGELNMKENAEASMYTEPWSELLLATNGLHCLQRRDRLWNSPGFGFR